MKTKYEGVYCLSDSLKEDALAAASDNVRSDIRKVGGTILGEKPLERRSFARIMQKQQGGYYLEIAFEIETDKIAALKQRHRLDGNVFRVMIVRARKPAPEATAAAAAQ